MAKSFATCGHFLVRDAPSEIVSVVYPGLISPAWWLHPMSTTYGLAKAINVVLMTAAAVPALPLGSPIGVAVWALLAVALSLLMPSFVYTGMLMTENAFLPAFVLAAFAFALALERPTLLRQLLAFAAILLAVASVYQGLVLLLVLPTAIVLKVAARATSRVEAHAGALRMGRASPLLDLRRALVVGAACIYVLREIARGH